MPLRNLRRWAATSGSPAARAARAVVRGVRGFELPAPRLVFRPILGAYVACRSARHFVLRVFVCQPLFRAYCTRCGKGLRTDRYIHWIQGSGDLIVGDRVTVDGKVSINFAARYTDRPTLEIGSDVVVGHGSAITVGDRVTIGDHCLIAAGVRILDSSGHPADPAARLRGEPAPRDKVRPVSIGPNVWIGARAVVLPGTVIGEGSVISAASVVRGTIPPFVVVAGNPGQVVSTLRGTGPGPEN